jgi:hypothetical protein
MRRAAVFMFGALCMAPTAGDVGGCGAEVTELNAQQYAFDRKSMDCTRCRECGFGTVRCMRACDATKSPDTSVPSTCKPVKHDGEVCLRALEVATCDAYSAYIDDRAPATPSECEFCQYVPPGPLPGFAVDAGQAAEAGAR